MRYEKYKQTGIPWLPEVPEGWDSERLKFLAKKIGSGKTPTEGASVYKDHGIIFLRSQNVYDEGLFLSDVAFISEDVDE